MGSKIIWICILQFGVICENASFSPMHNHTHKCSHQFGSETDVVAPLQQSEEMRSEAQSLENDTTARGKNVLDVTWHSSKNHLSRKSQRVTKRKHGTFSTKQQHMQKLWSKDPNERRTEWIFIKSTMQDTKWLGKIFLNFLTWSPPKKRGKYKIFFRKGSLRRERST